MDDIEPERNEQARRDALANETATNLKGELLAVLGSVLEGAAVDIEALAGRIADDVASAAAYGDVQVLAELRAQVPALLEMQRLRAANGRDDALRGVLGTIIDVAARAARAALTAAAVVL